MRDETSVSRCLARSLLLKNKWNTEKSIEEFENEVCGGGVEKIFNFKFADKKNLDPNDEDTCCICYYEVPLKDMAVNEDCGHIACKECYLDYLETKIKDHGPGAVTITCIQAGCKLLVP